MATPVLLAHLDGDLAYVDTGAGGTGTATGAVRFRTGYTGGVEAALVEETTTNLVTNPLFHVDTAGWVARSGSSIARTTDTPLYGDGSLRVTAAAHSQGAETASGQIAAATGEQVYFSVYLRQQANVGSTQVRLVIAEKDSGNNWLRETAGSAFSLTTGQWSRHTLTATMGASTTSVYVFVEQFGGTSITFDIAGAQAEKKNHVTSACPELSGGTLVSGYTFAGTAHASTSTRAAASVALPLASAPAAVACRYSEDFGTTWAFAYTEVLAAANIGTYGAITHDGTDLVLASARALTIGPVMAFSDTLSAGEQTTLENTATWSLDMFAATRTAAPVLVPGRTYTGPLRAGHRSRS